MLDAEPTGTSVPPERSEDASQLTANAPQCFDDTHLKQGTGAQFFGSMVARLLVANQPALAAYEASQK